MTNGHSSVLMHAQHLNKIRRIGNTSINVFMDANFKIYTGEYVTITGLYGKARESFINILGCIHKADSGKYYFDYNDICCANEQVLGEIRNKKIGFIFSDFKLIDHLSIIENVELPLKYSEFSAAVKHDKAKEALTRVGFCGDIYSRPDETADFDKQKAAIARSLIHAPLLLIADEPTYHLDADSARGILEILKSVNNEGVAIVTVSSQSEVIYQADRILSFLDGNLISDSASYRADDIHSFKEKIMI